MASWFTDIAKSIAVPIGGALISGYVSGKQTSKANKALDQSTDASLAEVRRQYDLDRSDTEQQRAVNAWAMQRLQGMSDGSIAIEDTPGYDFRLQEGNKAIERMRSAGGNFMSGRTAKELMRYGSDYASSEYGNEWNRLSQLAGLGAGGIGAGGQASTNIANIFGQQGANRASIAGAQNAGLQGSMQNVMDAFNQSQLLTRLGR